MPHRTDHRRDMRVRLKEIPSAVLGSAASLEAEGHDRAVAAARAELEENAFETAWAEGQATTPEEIVLYSIEGPSVAPRDRPAQRAATELLRLRELSRSRRPDSNRGPLHYE